MSTLKKRKTRELEIEQIYLATLYGSNKRLDAQKREKKHKKKTAQELFERLDVAYISGLIIRPAYQYIPKSYNIDRQTVGLIDHLFVKYPVPDFFYNICIKGRFTDVHIKQTYQQWFTVLAQGGSFRKLVQDIMTSKEAATFLAGPYEDIHDNVWWAKMTIAGVPRSILYRLIDRIFHDYDVKHFASRRMAELIQFYAQYGDQMELNRHRQIVQVRGYCNRSPNEQERNIIHHWASHKGFCYTP